MAITVGELLERSELGVTAVAGQAGLARTIAVPRIQKPGLALTGWPEQLHPNRVLVIGGTEIDYLADHETARTAGIATLFTSDPACIVVCRSLEPGRELRAAAEAQGVPLLVSTLVTADFIASVTAWMADRLAPTTQLHGVLVDVLGIGVLMIGKSGIGKSETALDLVVRGHRLVADDVIALRRQGNTIVGRSGGILGHHMEIRGLGIINIKDLFGIGSVRESEKIELIVELHEWDAAAEYDRLGLDEPRESMGGGDPTGSAGGAGGNAPRGVDEHVDRLLDIEVPKIRLPVRPGRNLATLIEVAARNQLLKAQGIHSARAFRDKIHQVIKDTAPAGGR